MLSRTVDPRTEARGRRGVERRASLRVLPMGAGASASPFDPEGYRTAVVRVCRNASLVDWHRGNRPGAEERGLISRRRPSECRHRRHTDEIADKPINRPLAREKPLRAIAATVDADVLNVFAGPGGAVTGNEVAGFARRFYAGVTAVVGRIGEGGRVRPVHTWRAEEGLAEQREYRLGARHSQRFGETSSGSPGPCAAPLTGEMAVRPYCGEWRTIDRASRSWDTGSNRPMRTSEVQGHAGASVAWLGGRHLSARRGNWKAGDERRYYLSHVCGEWDSDRCIRHRLASSTVRNRSLGPVQALASTDLLSETT